MLKKIDPLNKKQYGAVTAMLTVSDVKAAATFYQKAFGFEKRVMMNGPDGKAMHGELTLRGTTLMLGPENPERGARSAKTLGGSPVTLDLFTENVYKVVATAIKLGATPRMPSWTCKKINYRGSSHTTITGLADAVMDMQENKLAKTADSFA